jgi:hypothetical protein
MNQESFDARNLHVVFPCGVVLVPIDYAASAQMARSPGRIVMPTLLPRGRCCDTLPH